MADTWNEVINFQILQNINSVRKTTQPLQDIFGIEYFTYHRISNEGKYTVLLDRPDFAEHYVCEKFYQLDPYLHHPDAYTTGFCLVDMNGSPEYKEKVQKVGTKFQLDLGVCLIKKNKDNVEFFGFSGSKFNSALNKLYLNHQSLLVSFAEYFKNEHAEVIHSWDDVAPSLEILKEKKLEKRALSLQLPDENVGTFLKALGMNQYVKQAELFSPKEKQCLKWLLKGKSAKETGKCMNISSRTVESYFDTIKSKLGCWSKNEVFEIAQTLQNLGLLP